jgi:AP-3 complex subunit delta-1
VKYVALLAFNKIVVTHPYLVAQQEDVIMECIDSPDISIRLRALDLVVGMVNSDNLMSIVGRLMRQLKNSRSATAEELNPRPMPIEPAADSDDESSEVAIKSGKGSSDAPLLPDDYKIDVITRILEMCSSNNYGNLVDFDWYIDILIQLVRTAPVASQASLSQDSEISSRIGVDVSVRIGDELRSVAVKVKAIRLQATRAAESILVSTYNDSSSPLTSGSGVLRPISWIVGEYASFLESPDGTFTALLQLTKGSTPAEALVIFLQALPKIFGLVAGDDQTPWTPERKTMISLLMARIIHALEPLVMHPDLEVQERAVEFSELLKLAAEASSGQPVSSDTIQQDAPLLLTQAIPSLFTGLELNSVATGAQKNVPIPSTLDLDQPINANLSNLLRAVNFSSFDEPDDDEFESYYHQKPPAAAAAVVEPVINRLNAVEEPVHSYQQGSEDSYLDPDIVARRRAERLERNKDDPFYIPPTDDRSSSSTPLHSILQSNNGRDLDIDAIPIMQLDLGKTDLNSGQASPKRPAVPKARPRIQIAADETLAISGTSTPRNEDSENILDVQQRPKPRGKNSLLLVDSSHIGSFSLEGDDSSGMDFERQQKAEAEMAKAMLEVEKLRLEMQRANERIQAAEGVEGTVVKKKKKKPKPADPQPEGVDAVTVVKKKKKVKKAVADDTEAGQASITADIVKPKKKKKKTKIDEGTAGNDGSVIDLGA